ncbi:PREDICTED: oxysterol-binding protein-related protein 3 isoform X2 [Nanorana parkeri]|uniref:oxysterol-binding protein-related protein 3 isoform X2 n=1 Tax=Nanorana parkeri TaxID=125878 RepID=UPI000854AD06|nr:PREDICTED: oxysterol-binding protein-related protein 3 isoform X2 [Nanorana parkeri]
MGDERNLGVSQKMLSPSRSTSSSSSKLGSRQDSWEIVEGLRGSNSCTQEPQKQEGFLLKKRKWPLKGWHKRYFFVDKGILKYAKGPNEMEKGKLHGRIDVGLSVMSVKKSTKCIDLDTEEHIYHLKVKSPEVFEEWVTKLRDHRLFRQNEISVFPHDLNSQFFPMLSTTESTSSLDPVSSPQETHFTRQNSLKLAGSRVPAWLQSNDDMDKCAKDLSQCQSHLVEMNQLLQSMEVLHRTYSAPAINAIQAGALESPKKEKVNRKKWRTKGVNKDSKGSLQVPQPLSGNVRLHASNPNLSTIDYIEEKQYSNGADSSNFCKMQDDLCHIAHKAYFTLKSAYSTVLAEREKLKQLLETDSSPTAQKMGLKNALSVEDTCEESKPLLHQMSNESRLSITDSLTEFYDAQEVLLSSSSSENEVSDDDSYVSDISDNISEDNLSNDIERQSLDGVSEVDGFSKHRTCLPATCPNTSNISLWNILRNNIGKDLSKVSMPVQLNEPLNTLQRLCEELEYTELLDKASLTQDPFERMVYIATFAVSAYAPSFYRAGSKPFNPVLGETYESINELKGYRFIAEQVSHHPPVSACHAESDKFALYQDIRWKNKFWGKSMEIVPVGTTHLILPGFEDHYEWNKVTSCIHNILSGQRWIEHYGEIIIKNTKNDGCHCKVTFIKTKYWNPNVHEIEGTVMDKNGKVVHRLFGKWHESIFCGSPSSPVCIWRTNPMPKDSELYYGFTKYALQLNEFDPKTKLLLPCTDSRFRPDQRLLEEGNVDGAEAQKQRIEQLQRERRRVLEENNLEHQPRFFRKSSDDSWVTNNTYWQLRKDHGFSKMDCPVLW